MNKSISSIDALQISKTTNNYNLDSIMDRSSNISSTNREFLHLSNINYKNYKYEKIFKKTEMYPGIPMENVGKPIINLRNKIDFL